MPFPRAMIMDTKLLREQQVGDVIPTGELLPTVDTTVTALAITAAKLLNTIINRGPATASADTLPDAAALIATVGGTVAVNTSWRVRYRNSGAGVITVTAAANNGSAVTEPTINATSVKDFLVTVTNGTPQSVVTNLATTNASAIVTGFTQAQTDALSVGQTMISNVAGMQGFKIIGIVPGVSVTLSGNATSTATAQTMTFYPNYTVQGMGQGLI